jgi:hypothetical protein
VHGSHEGNTNAVEATVTRTIPTFFMRVLGTNSATIQAYAVARGSTNQGSIGGCIFALNKSMQTAMNVNGSSLNLHSKCSMDSTGNECASGTAACCVFDSNSGHSRS